MSTPTPPGDVSVTAATCPACGAGLPAGRSRRFCSAACRQAAYRRRHQSVDEQEAPLPRRRSRLEGTTNAPNARRATWASNGAMTVQCPANASAREVSARGVRR